MSEKAILLDTNALLALRSYYWAKEDEQQVYLKLFGNDMELAYTMVEGVSCKWFCFLRF